jgi:hypothetical protein
MGSFSTLPAAPRPRDGVEVHSREHHRLTLTDVEGNLSLNVSEVKPGPTPSNGSPVAICFYGVAFNLQLQEWFSSGGARLNASAQEPDGSFFWVTIGGGLLYGCGFVAGTTCLESGTPDHTAAVLWDGGQDVTLMVRTG